MCIQVQLGTLNINLINIGCAIAALSVFEHFLFKDKPKEEKITSLRSISQYVKEKTITYNLALDNGGFKSRTNSLKKIVMKLVLRLNASFLLQELLVLLSFMLLSCSFLLCRIELFCLYHADVGIINRIENNENSV